MQTARILVRNTAMRAANIRKFSWTQYDGERVQWIPATRELKAHLDGLTKVGALVMLTPTGKAYTKRYFNDHWREDADKVKAGDLNFHDNRGTAATLLAEAGATAPYNPEAMPERVENEICKPPCKRAAGVNRERENGLEVIEEFGRSERI